MNYLVRQLTEQAPETRLLQSLFIPVCRSGSYDLDSGSCTRRTAQCHPRNDNGCYSSSRYDGSDVD